MSAPCRRCGASVFDHEPTPTGPAGPPYTRGGVTPTPAYLAICEDTGVEALVPAETTSCEGYLAPGAAGGTRGADIAGGLEVRRTHRGTWGLHLSDGTDMQITLPRKRNATAVRQLLLDVLPDWSDVPPTGWPDRVTPDQRAAASRVVGMVGRVQARQSRGMHPCCGHRTCACGTDSLLDGPHYTADELAWAQ